MIKRSCKLSKSNSYFLFGARGTGKSSLLRENFKNEKTLWIDLLNDELVDQYQLQPQSLLQQISILSKENRPRWIVIDEVQKVPKLLNVVHQIIESDLNIKFALTGSSARRLKQKGINLLAGRAWVEDLFPLTHRELGDAFDLNMVLKWGSLPKMTELKQAQEKGNYLRSYALTYIKTEIQEEQWVRKIEPFRRFLPIAAQMNGQPINASSIARDVGVDVTTVQSYFEILEDTLIGFSVPGYSKSIRKQQRQAAKFYFFDLGVRTSLEGKLNLELHPRTSEYGNAFEHFIICEIFRLNKYKKADYHFSYLRTKDNVEIDLIIERPGQKIALVEIKSKTKVDDRDCQHLESIQKDLPNSECFLLSQDSVAKKIGKVKAFSWQQGITELGL